MPTPVFIRELREKIGHAPLWLSGASGVVQHPSGDVLLVKRADTGWWSNVGGIIEPGEQPADAVEREVLEEAGVVVRAEKLAWVHVLQPVTWPNGDQGQLLEMVFVCSFVTGEPRPVDGEATAAAWFPLDQLPELRQRDRDRITVALSGDESTRFERSGPGKLTPG